MVKGLWRLNTKLGIHQKANELPPKEAISAVSPSMYMPSTDVGGSDDMTATATKATFNHLDFCSRSFEVQYLMKIF